jgi:release factor glutamine methyltransferase
MSAADASRDVRGLLASGAERLARAGVAGARVDAELLLAHALDFDRGRLRVLDATGADVPAAAADAYAAAVARREAREPLQHITGRAAFRHLELAVGPGVFVPRPETELLAQLGIDALRAATATEPVGVDLGTGSGAVALALVTEAPTARVVAVEREPAAADWAERNIRALGDDRIRLVRADLDGALPELDGAVDVVVSNPPYIPDDAVPVDPEVQRHDPPTALYGGADGLDVIRRVSATALRLLRPGGLLAIEHADVQGGAVRDLLAVDGWSDPVTHRDLTGRDRVTAARR